MKKKTILIVLVLLAALACVFAIWKLHTDTPAVATVNPGWKVYENKKFGFSVEYPPTFVANEKAYPEDNALSIAIVDPNTGFQYVPISVWGRQSDIDAMNDYFVGPYPKEMPPAGNNSSRTVVERTLGGVKGVEYYGIGGEGRSYDDAFVYKDAYLYGVYLDPVIEGRITEYREPGTPLPTEAYRDMYERILASIKINTER